MRRTVAAARSALGRRGDASVKRTPISTPLELAPLALNREEGGVANHLGAARVARVKDSRGVQLLAKLASSPGERVHALVLAGDGDAALPESDAGDVIDRKACPRVSRAPRRHRRRDRRGRVALRRAPHREVATRARDTDRGDRARPPPRRPPSESGLRDRARPHQRHAPPEGRAPPYRRGEPGAGALPRGRGPDGHVLLLRSI